MNRLFLLMVLTALILVVGCESDKTSSPVSAVNEQLNLFLPESAVVGAAGVEVVVPVTVQVTDNGGAVSRVVVRFRVLGGSGDMTLKSVQTDAEGLAVSELRATLARGSQKTTIGVYTDNASVEGKITLKGTGLPVAIAIGVPQEALVAPLNAPVKINLRAQLTDANGYGVGDIPLKYALIGPDGPAIGSVSGDSASRADGSVQFAYSVFCTGAREEIIISTDTTIWKGAAISDTIAIQVKTILSRINWIAATATPNLIDLDEDSIGYSLIRVIVADANGVGIPNIDVHFLTNLGTLSDLTPTDEAGVATAKFCSNGETGVAEVSISIPGTGFETSVPIWVRSRSILAGSIQLTSNVDFIYADNGLTFATLRVILKDQENRAMVGKLVTFHCGFGSVNPSAQTDSLGQATAYFVDQGIPSLDNDGNLVPVRIYAKYRSQNLVDSVDVTIRPKNPVASITLNATKLSMQAGTHDSSALRATCFLRSGAFAPQGTIVRFDVDQNNGSFTDETVPVGFYGVAETYYTPGPFVGIAVLRALVVNEGGGADSVLYSNDVRINLLAGPPSGIRMRADPNILNIDDRDAFSTITAIITDTTGNPVRQGELVFFSTDKGGVSPNTALTDTLGRAQTRLFPDNETGTAVVTGGIGAIRSTCTVTFNSGYPNSIEIHPDGPLQIAVRGTGGISETGFEVWVKDLNGNLISEQTTVVAQLLNNPNPPLGCNLGDNGDSDSAQTVGGIAHFTFGAGEQIGGKVIRAYTWRDPEWAPPGPDGLFRTDTISVISTDYSVITGPPFQLDIDVNANGEDAGGGTWQVQVSARVWDVHRNPVADRIPVTFTVDPQIATIDPGFTGNDIGDGATPGIAYSYLRYHSVNTNDPVTISAEVQAPDGLITGERPWTLPLQRGRIELSVDPGNVMFDRGRPNDTCVVRVWALVTDGHGVTINNSPVLFTTDRARFYWRNLRLNGRYIPFFPEVARRYTGLINQENNEERGVATLYLRGIMDDFFLDAFALETTTRIEARVEGADGVEAEPASVRMTRH